MFIIISTPYAGPAVDSFKPADYNELIPLKR